MPEIQADALRDAQRRAFDLFDEVLRKGLVAPGVSEQALNDHVRDLAKEVLGTETFWHKRIVRSGPNTLCPYAENPPDRILSKQDIVFFDFGPVLAKWEADVGITVVLGDDADMHRLKQDVEACWRLGKARFDAEPGITGSQLYGFVCSLAEERGWTYAQEHCGHLIGEFPHERIQGEESRNYIHPDNHTPLRDPDHRGAHRDWILEVHFVDRAREIGAFVERLLTVDAPGHGSSWEGSIGCA